VEALFTNSYIMRLLRSISLLASVHISLILLREALSG